ncbi:MAG: class I adenylate-forming enzyme family protein [Piscinibacter sp.]|uniref:class I adenylate-forming enzyme family protein n=1 Tax=Piscinibacter sp. TaxID=1903157 RepID=UPI003D0C7C2D
MFIDASLGTLHEPLTGRRVDGPAALLQSRRRATLLHHLGVRRHAKVFLHYGNKAEFFIDLLALWSLGACPVPVDPRYTAFEVEVLLAGIQPVLSIWDESAPAELAAVLAARQVPVVDTVSAAASVDEALFAPGWPHLDDDALLLLTSGTTGQPKGVLQTHRALRSRWNQQRERLGVAAFAQTLCVVPTHFAWGLVGHALYAWLSGQTLHLLPAFRSDTLMRLGSLCDDLAVTCLPSVPSMWQLVVKTVAPPRGGALQLVTLGTAPLQATIWRGVRQWGGGAEVLNVYGISETGWIAGGALDEAAGDDVPVGEPWGAVVKVLASGSTAQGPGLAPECAPGEPGHLWVQTPSLMRGYFGRDDLTAQVVTRGWFCTGDLGQLDERGRIVLRGREKELINVGGAKIYPQDIDAALAGLPGVEDVATFAFDDPMLGENVAVALVLADPGEAALLAVYREAVRRLAVHQLPRRWHLVEQIPRTARGKLSRSDVARRCAGAQPAFEQRVLERLLRAAAA